jgi:hypothetical protein
MQGLVALRSCILAADTLGGVNVYQGGSLDCRAQRQAKLWMATSRDNQAADICIKESCSGGNSRAQPGSMLSSRGRDVKGKLRQTSALHTSATDWLHKHTCKANHFVQGSSQLAADQRQRSPAW